MALTARDIMTPSVKAVPQSWAMQQLSRFLTDNELTGTPVEDASGTIVGIVTLKDIAEFQWNSTCAGALAENKDENSLTPQEQAEARQLRQRMFQQMSRTPVEVRDIMTPNPVAVSIDTCIFTVATTMMQEHLHRILVTSGTSDTAVVGIITTYDMLRVIANPDLMARCLERD